MTHGLKNIKLWLLGITAVAIPILFIFQADNINIKKDELMKVERVKDSLAGVNFKQTELIGFYKAELSKRTPGDSSRNIVSFNPIISTQDNANLVELMKGQLSEYKTLKDSLLIENKRLKYDTVILASEKKDLIRKLRTICSLNDSLNKRNTQSLFKKIESICNEQ